MDKEIPKSKRNPRWELKIFICEMYNQKLIIVAIFDIIVFFRTTPVNPTFGI